jgi:arabinan endo-1,5-alpha-L-arabinosidase
MPFSMSGVTLGGRQLPLGMVLVWLAFGMGGARAQMPVLGDYWAHDPSRIVKQGNTYYTFRTSQGIMGKSSTDLRNWVYSGQVFPNGPPAWTTSAVPGFTGFFWAPDVVFLNGVYYLYYSCSTFGSQVSAIGLATATSLAGPWTDQGAVIQSGVGDPYNCIDASPLVAANGTMWLAFGSYWNGIYLMQLNPATGKRISPTSPLTHLAWNGSIEAAYLHQRGAYYYLFVNWDRCCASIDSTYRIRVGRSTSVTGPYLDRNGVNMTAGGGSRFLESTARYIGPGHAGIMNDNGTNYLTYHYYDGNDGGTAKLGLGRLNWSDDGWPIFTNDWSALYTFNVGAREHLSVYNGTRQNDTVVTNDPDRGNVLHLDGITNSVSLPISVANARTFAGWVKWNGGQGASQATCVLPSRPAGSVANSKSTHHSRCRSIPGSTSPSPSMTGKE